MAGISKDLYKFSDFAIARYNTDGGLDTTFSEDGKQTTDFALGYDGANSVAIQNDGRIVAAGYSFPDGLPDGANGIKTENLALARYRTDGTPDVSFSKDGKQTIEIGTGAVGITPFAMAIQSDGKIVAAGSAVTGYASDFALAVQY